MHQNYNTSAFPAREEGKAELFNNSDAPGLLIAHNRPQNLSCGLFWLNGSMMKVQRNYASEEQKGGGRRGKVDGFSRQSKSRFSKSLARVDKRIPAAFCTLTFDDEYFEKISSPKEGKILFNNLRKRFRRAFPSGSGFWKQEFKKRKSGSHIGAVVPHYHLLIFGVDMMELRCWIAINWYQVCGLSIKHLGAGTSVVLADEKARRYIAKYMDKDIDFDDIEDTGRCWGTINIEKIPFVKAILCQLNEKEAVILLRYMRRYAHIHGRDMKAMTLFCNPDFWYDRLPDILHTG